MHEPSVKQSSHDSFAGLKDGLMRITSMMSNESLQTVRKKLVNWKSISSR
jgi:hypothetical protein